MENYKDRLIELKLRGYEPFIGVFLNFGEEWIIIRNISGDYIIDGFKLINRKYILNIQLVEEEPIRTITDIKHSGFQYKLGLNLDSTTALLQSLLNEKTLLLITLYDENAAYVGLIDTVNQKSLILHDLSSRGEFTNYNVGYKYQSIRVIEIKTDYLNSLDLYINNFR
jgi:hypothetical protein